jgi:glyoxylase-like metal-dependent hydrolase (beta-lactamase superfamily II)
MVWRLTPASIQNTFKKIYIMENPMRRFGQSLSSLSRREMLQLLACGAATASFLPGAARAAASFAAGEGELTVVSDGNLVLPAAFIFPEIAEAERTALLTEFSLPTDTLSPDCNVSLLRSGDRLAIFDVGSGPNFMSTAGKLVENLAEAGIDPADVTDVIFTHAHPDHFWGLTDELDELVFPEATYRMAEAEWNFWRADDTLDQMPEDRKSFVVGAQSRMPLIEDRIELFAPGTEVFPSVEAVDTPGHTPGHVSFMVHGGDPMLIAGDVLSNTVSFAKPDWHWGTDQDPALGAQTRAKLLDRLAADKVRLIGFHLPHPGNGMVEAQGAAYRFVPAT